MSSSSDAEKAWRAWRDELVELEATLADAEQTMVELAPAEVLVEGSWFKPSDLPSVLGNYMRATAEAQREAKEDYIRVVELQGRVVELEAVIEQVRAGAILIQMTPNPNDTGAYCLTGEAESALFSISPSQVLADRDADKWDEGHKQGEATAIGGTNYVPNPYCRRAVEEDQFKSTPENLNTGGGNSSAVEED